MSEVEIELQLHRGHLLSPAEIKKHLVTSKPRISECRGWQSTRFVAYVTLEEAQKIAGDYLARSAANPSPRKEVITFLVRAHLTSVDVGHCKDVNGLERVYRKVSEEAARVREEMVKRAEVEAERLHARRRDWALKIISKLEIEPTEERIEKLVTFAAEGR